jgi:prephenate dehydrogenase
MRPDTLGVIGLGAIGGSVAWQATRARIPRVLGYSPIPSEGVAAVREGAITEVAPTVQRLVREADLVVIAAPPAATLEQLRTIAAELRRRNVLCTDVSSIKGPIVRLAESLDLSSCFAGSHPLAGTHRSGFAAARPDLFNQALVYVTPLKGDEAAGREVADFWAGVMSAAPVTMDAKSHDMILAWTSHLPQVASSALAAALARSGPQGMTYGTGARDATRLAASSVEMWRDVLLLNRAAVLEAIEGLEDSLGTLRQALTRGDVEALTEWLDRAAMWRRKMGE